MSTSGDLKDIFAAGRPLVEQALDLAEQIAALRDAATMKGLDWSQVKALLKAQIQDERDGGDGRRVRKIIDKADFATAYAEMLGLANMNEKNIFAHDTETGEIIEPQTIPGTGTTAQAAGLPPPIPAAPAADFSDMSDTLKRKRAA